MNEIGYPGTPDFLLARLRPRGLRTQTAAKALRCLNRAGLMATQDSGRTPGLCVRCLIQ